MSGKHPLPSEIDDKVDEVESKKSKIDYNVVADGKIECRTSIDESSASKISVGETVSEVLVSKACLDEVKSYPSRLRKPSMKAIAALESHVLQKDQVTKRKVSRKKQNVNEEKVVLSPISQYAGDNLLIDESSQDSIFDSQKLDRQISEIVAECLKDDQSFNSTSSPTVLDRQISEIVAECLKEDQSLNSTSSPKVTTSTSKRKNTKSINSTKIGKETISKAKTKKTIAKAKTTTSKTKETKIPKSKNTTTSSKKTKAANKAPDDENKRKRCMPKTVDKRLKEMGIDVERVSWCVKAGMCKGFIKLTGDSSDLDQHIMKGSYDGHVYTVTLKDVLYQSDYGSDYEDGSLDATAMCDCCKGLSYRYQAYVTRICQGKPELNDGKFHNHCHQCKGFGTCIGDYREAHCERCKKHYFAGNYGFPCDNCERNRGGGRGNNDCVIS